MDSRSLSVLSLCAGVGGLDLGFRMAQPNARTVCFVEIEAFACEILATRMEDKTMDEAPIWTDLRTFDGKPWRGLVDCITAGYPCQPFSVAGKQSQMPSGSIDCELGNAEYAGSFTSAQSRGNEKNDGTRRRKSQEQKDPAIYGEQINWPTPIASEQKHRLKSNSQQSKSLTSTVIQSHHSRPDQMALGTKSQPVLNPRFVEWLMGWPIGWTEFEPVETVSSHWLPLMRGSLLQLQEMENNFYDRQSKTRA